MRLGPWITVLALFAFGFAFGSAPAHAELPSHVSARLDQAVDLSETDEFTGSFTMSMVSMVQKPNGRNREETSFEAEIENLEDGNQKRKLLKFFENGSDVTESQREKFESRNGSAKKEDDDDQDFIDPFGQTADRYRFSDPVAQGSEVVASFEPAEGFEDEPKMARGRVAWNPDTLEPMWLEMEALHAPKPLKQLTIRLEFMTRGEETFVMQMETEGLAKVLLMQREFRVELSFDNLRPAGPIRP